MPTPDLDLITLIPNSLQDDNPTSSDVGNNAEILYQEQLRRLAVEDKALSVGFGEDGRRRGAGPVFRRLEILSGTFTSAGVDCTGVGTQAGVEFDVDDWIQPRGRSGEYRRVVSVASPLSWTVDRAWSPDVTIADNIDLLEYLAERLDDLNNRTQNITADATDTDIGSNLNLVAGNSFLYDDQPTNGTAFDGRPTASKEISITITDGNTTASGAHLITNAHTDNRIHSVTLFIKQTTETYYQGTASTYPTPWYYNNTNLYIQRSSSSGTITARCLIGYYL